MRRLFYLTLFFCATTFANSTHYIIDTDMGFDDWMAVLYLLKQPVIVDAITIDCRGETFCPQGAKNAARLTHIVQHDVPIAIGTAHQKTSYDFPLKIRNYATQMSVPEFHHIPIDHDITKISAAHMIVNTVIDAAKHHQHVVIISIGTAANIADAWKLAEKTHQTKAFRRGLFMIYKGGGAFGKIIHRHITNHSIPGNIAIPGVIKSNNTTAEWNIYADAPAMQTLIDAKLPITFIPTNATHAVNITKKSYAALYDGSVPGTTRRFDANAIQTLVSMQGGWKMISHDLDYWDLATTMAALHPQLVTETLTHVPVRITLDPDRYYGTTWISYRHDDRVTVDYRLNRTVFYKMATQSGNSL